MAAQACRWPEVVGRGIDRRKQDFSTSASKESLKRFLILLLGEIFTLFFPPLLSSLLVVFIEIIIAYRKDRRYFTEL